MSGRTVLSYVKGFHSIQVPICVTLSNNLSPDTNSEWAAEFSTGYRGTQPIPAGEGLSKTALSSRPAWGTLPSTGQAGLHTRLYPKQ